MDASVFLALALACAPQVHADTARALVSVERLQPVGDRRGRRRARAPARHRAEALATAKGLRDAGWNFSVGLGQINVGNFDRLGLTVETASSPAPTWPRCRPCSPSASTARADPSKAVDQGRPAPALSCYYSGNFDTGFRHGYVRKVVVAARAVPTAQPKEAMTTLASIRRAAPALGCHRFRPCCRRRPRPGLRQDQHHGHERQHHPGDDLDRGGDHRDHLGRLQDDLPGVPAWPMCRQRC